jgi:hypothetical protein
MIFQNLGCQWPRADEGLSRLRMRLARALQLTLIVVLILMIAFPAVGQTPIPEENVDQVVSVFQRLGSLFIRAAFGLMFVVFAVGSVKNGLGAQIAYQFGVSHRMSAELLNLAGGVIIFALGLLTLTMVQFIIDTLEGTYRTTLDLPRPEITIE